MIFPSLSYFNDLITQVNNLAADPPEGCDPIDPIPLVTNPHFWAKGDITALQNVLKQICSNNSFTAPLKFWDQAFIQEILDAISNGWCHCEGCHDTATTDIPFKTMSFEFEISNASSAGWFVPTNIYHALTSITGGDPLQPYINGLSTHCPNQRWEVHALYTFGPDAFDILVAVGTSDGDKKIVYNNSAFNIIAHWGIRRAHVDGIDEPTSAEAEIQALSSPIVYIIRYLPIS